MSTTNIFSVYNLASVSDRLEGANWYPEAYRKAEAIAKAYNISTEKSVGVIAALSPRNRWERNLADAENLIKVYTTDPESAPFVKVSTFNKLKQKALNILADGDNVSEILNILNGPKLCEFAKCILGYTEEVCIDGHAYSVWLGDRLTLDNIPSIGVKLRRTIKADYRAVAAELSIPTAHVQAITWCCWRRIHGI